MEPNGFFSPYRDLGLVLHRGGTAGLERRALGTGRCCDPQSAILAGSWCAFYNDQGPLDVFYEDDASYPLRFPLWYVYAKAMWDPDLTGSEILMDACNKLYGPVSDLMFAYYEALADIAEHNTAQTIAWHPPAPRELYTPERVERLDRLMQLVRQASQTTDGAVRKRLEVQMALWGKAKEVIATGELVD